MTYPSCRTACTARCRLAAESCPADRSDEEAAISTDLMRCYGGNEVIVDGSIIHGPPRPVRSSSHAREADSAQSVQSDMKTVVAADQPVRTIKHPTGSNQRVRHAGARMYAEQGGVGAAGAAGRVYVPGAPCGAQYFRPMEGGPQPAASGDQGCEEGAGKCTGPTGTDNARSSLVATEGSCFVGIRDRLCGRTAGTASRPLASAWPG